MTDHNDANDEPEFEPININNWTPPTPSRYEIGVSAAKLVALSLYLCLGFVGMRDLIGRFDRSWRNLMTKIGRRLR